MEKCLYSILKENFENKKNDLNAKKMSAYMRNLFDFYGINAEERRNIYKEYLKEEKKNKEIDWKLLDMCFDDRYREMQYFVLDYLRYMNEFLVYEDIFSIKKYIQIKSWWDTIDVFDVIIGNIGLTDNRVDRLMLDWSVDNDFWIRRVAIDHQRLRKNKTNVELLENIIINNFGSDEFFINKAIGWSLREYSKVNPEFVGDFIKKNKNQMNKLSIREASKYL